MSVIPCQVNRLWMPQRERGAGVTQGRPQGIEPCSIKIEALTAGSSNGGSGGTFRHLEGESGIQDYV
jgi:hypothetical protein